MRLLESGMKAKEVVLLCTPFSGKFLDNKVRASVTAACKKGFDFEKIKLPAEIIGLVPKRIAFDMQIMPLVQKGHELLVATSDFKNTKMEPEIIPQFQVRMALSTPEDIEKALIQYYGNP